MPETSQDQTNQGQKLQTGNTPNHWTLLKQHLRFERESPTHLGRSHRRIANKK